MTKNKGLYLHIPFCHARCGYCDFVTFTGKEDKVDRYVEELCQEIALQSASVSDPGPLQTAFFGGGTPSLLEPEQVEAILSAIHVHHGLRDNAEVTLEANPESITLEKAMGWRASGVNRLSIGLQAFDNILLKVADRLHTVEDFMKAYTWAREAGFTNINIDLIYGLPGQTLSAWQETLRKTLALKPEHLSMYSLKVEEHTPFAAQGITVHEDLQADMYESARTALKQAGYDHYEVSNFALPDYACAHNLIYWRQDDYFAVGAGAVGCIEGNRWENHKNLSDYSRDLAAGKLPQLTRESLSENVRRFEHLMLGLRLREGLLWNEQNPDWLRHRADLQTQNLLEQIPNGRWRVPDHAVLLTHRVLLPFLS